MALSIKQNESSWASALLLVSKPGASGWRFTVNLRPMNRFTIHCHYPMLNIGNELTKLVGSEDYTNFDLSRGYWQLPLETSSQEYQNLVTSDGIFTPTQVLHGTTNTVIHLRSVITANLNPFQRQHLLVWLDDILIFSNNRKLLLKEIRSVLDICKN